ncbi:S8 family serine peptidase [Phycicoccus sonneratiae]|uniref:S8 family serine peptidase n=1 Tax=Phycicoccus sonneratiae TaxID=2807628 RepID=A0ABS2CNT6_9MICO|nr:S8 family serine peptidase [Phycicoccus sonneraticus]MBM6401542.1 S8 family serine peptidase [Phycicoccus sonneraticus]
MRRSRMVALTGAVALAASALGATTATASGAATAGATTTARTGYAVLAADGTDARALAQRLAKAGATVTSVNTDIGLVSVESTSAGFAGAARSMSGVAAAARDGVVGRSPDARPAKDAVTRENRATSRHGDEHDHGHGPKGGKADPLDSSLWGMKLIGADKAHKSELGDKRVRVGVMDTGVDGTHPDLAPNFDKKLSRNFVTDMPDIDGPCEFASCVDPVDHDDDGHGTHVAGTMAAALNGIGVSGVAPNVDLVNVRAGQDSGYFFLTPTVNALTYSGDAGIDVVNMSFYVDPWAYNCIGGAPEDTPEQAAEQDLIIKSMTRALNYAHKKGVTLVGALGNGNDDLSNPRPDTSSPDYPGGTEHERTIDDATCFDLPVEGPHVLGVSSVGPSTRKADYSNWATDLRSGEIEVAAPGGWFRDGLGTDTYRTNGNLILSTAPLNVMQAEGQVDADGNITPAGEAAGTTKDCRTVKGKQVCGYYQYLQGTSMASPHAAGVAALAVSAHGKSQRHGGFGLAPDTVRRIVMGTATEHACPAGGVQSYEDVGRGPEYTATCTGTKEFNSFYGAGIVSASGVVARGHDHDHDHGHGH